MNHTKQLGAINKDTGEYEHPKIATKQNRYMCTECHNELILCQGNIRAPYFRHKVVSGNTCNHYTSPSEGEIHKDAKLLLKTLLERKNQIKCTRSCCFCKINEEFEIPEMTEGSVIKLEYRFEYNGPKIADVAYIDDDEIVCIFEICNTHKTNSENRPEPWFEIDAETLISMANDNSLTSLKIPCIRVEKCEVCINSEIFKQSIRMLNNGIGLSICDKYEQKYSFHGYTCDNALEFVVKCDNFIKELKQRYESEIYNKNELDKNIFDECYYSKYHRAITSIHLYGENWYLHNEEDGNELWGNWGGNKFINNGCYKPTMYKFIKYYKLLNPMNIKKYLKEKFALKQETRKYCELPHIESRRISQDINKEKCVL